MKWYSWVVGGLAITAAATTAVAACISVTAFLPVGAGATESPQADGMTKVKFYIDPVDGPSVEAHVHLYDFMPNTTYGVDIQTDQGGRDFFDIVTTNPAGNGTCTVHFPVSMAPTIVLVVIYRDTIDNDARDFGESFTDLNGNFCYDTGEPYEDADQSGAYTPGEERACGLSE